MTKQERTELLEYANECRHPHSYGVTAPGSMWHLFNSGERPNWRQGGSWADLAESMAYEWTDGP